MSQIEARREAVRSVIDRRIARAEDPSRKLDRHVVRFKGRTSPAEARPRPPPAVGRARLLSKWATMDWYEFALFQPTRAFVPGGCLITGGDRAWRCMEVF